MSEGKESKEDYENEGKGAGGDEDDEQAVPVRNFDWMPEGCVPLADGEYDAIVMGTGLTECIISGLLSVQGNNNFCFSFSVESVMTIFFLYDIRKASASRGPQQLLWCGYRLSFSPESVREIP
jgi:hypothetical protein